jgi:hypothetical protein
MNQRNVLSVMGCSGSLALAVVFASPASASLIAQPDADQLSSDVTLMSTTQTQRNTLRDALSCSCATCQTSQRQTMI